MNKIVYVFLKCQFCFYIFMENEHLINMLIYRSWHRGCKETDILLGNFAREKLKDLSALELSIYKELVEESDMDLYNWICDETIPINPKYQELIEKIRNYNKV